MSAALRVIVADDQALVREGLMTLLGTVEGFEAVASAADGAEAVRLAVEHRPDVVLMDLRMPVLDGVEATRQIREQAPGTEIVVLTTHADEASIIDALGAGARGYLTKDAGIAEITRAVAAAAAGLSLVDPIVQARLLAAASAGAGAASSGSGSGSGSGSASGSGSPVPESLPDQLTAREVEVLRLIAQGLSNHEIAASLVVSEATVKSHINHLFAKIGARDRAQAVHYAYDRGLTG